MNEILSPAAYIESLSDDRKPYMNKLREVILCSLPKGYIETISFGMLSYVVPHTIYPAGYHCNPIEPLPFISVASQKGHIGLYHMGLYADIKLLNWFFKEYKILYGKKPDMGKSCIRFKNMDKIPFHLIAELVSKIKVDDWVRTYEKQFLKK